MPAPTPTPFPHPFIGLVFDPAGMILQEVVAALAAGLAPPDPGKVWISGFPATVTGGPVSMPVPHFIIPPGLSWAPIPRAPAPKVGLRGKLPLPALPLPPPSDAVLMMGAMFVKMQGANAVRMGEVALSCSDPVRMPTSQVVSTGMNGLVTVGGPPGVDWQQVTLMAGQRALRTEWIADRVLNAAGKAIPEVFKRTRNIVHKSACVLTGHPVNVATGSVLTDAVDFDIGTQGSLPLRFTRDYNSSWFDRESTLGFGWVHSLDQRVWIEPHCIAFQSPDGREIEFSTRALEGGVMRKGDTLFDPVDRLTLRSHGQFRWTIRRSDGVVLEFSPIVGEAAGDTDRGLGRLTKIRSPDGKTIALAYDAKARLQSATDCAGRAASFEHDTRGRLRRIGLPTADGSGVRPHAEFRYDDAGDLVEVLDALGHVTRYRYDQHLLVEETNRNGLSFYFKYDGYGRFARCIETWGIDPARGAETGIYHHLIDHDRSNRRTVVTDSLRRLNVYEYDGAFMVTKQVGPMGGETSFAYDHAHREVRREDALGRVTETTYDARGNRVMLSEPGQRVTQFEYDDEDRCVAKTNPADARWAWAYDALGRVTAQTDPLGYMERYTYEPSGLGGIVDAAGYATRVERNEAGDVIAVTAPDGSTRRWDRDALGRVIGFTNELGQRQQFARDALGRVVQVDEPDGNVRQFGYDPEGNLVRARDRRVDVAMTYCGLGRLATRTIGESTTRFTYDTEEQLIEVSSPAGRAHRYQLSPLGEVDVEIGFDGREQQYERDALGRVVGLRRGGKQIRIDYGPDGEVLSVLHDGGPELRYQHRKDGVLVEASTEEVTVSFERDLLGRPIRETCGDDWVTSAYDHAGRRTVVESSRGAKVESTFDPRGSLTRLGASSGGVRWDATFSRNALGHEVDRQAPGNARGYWWRDELGRPTQHFVGINQEPMRLRKYGWDPGGRLRQLEEASQEPSVLEHDAAANLSNVLGPGNRVLHLHGRDRTFDDADALLEYRGPDGPVRDAYDANGNLQHREEPGGGQWFFHHDTAGQLVQIDRPDGAAVSLSYDALGRRILKNANGIVTRWLWDGLRPLHEWREDAEPPKLIRTCELAARRKSLLELRDTLNTKLGERGEAQWWSRLRADAEEDFVAAEVLREAQGESDSRFDPGPDPGPLVWLFGEDPFSPLARLSADAAHSIMSDHLGAPLCLVRAEPSSAAADWQCTIDAFGVAAVVGDRHLCPWRFPGQYCDAETEMHYNRFRYYDPARGDYIEPDPLGLEGGMNPYAYVADPTTQTDPLGLSSSGCAPPGFGPTSETIRVPGQHRYTELWAKLRDLPDPWEVGGKTPEPLRDIVRPIPTGPEVPTAEPEVGSPAPSEAQPD